MPRIMTPGQRKVANKKSPSIPTRAANPTASAGAKNSNGPKGGSGKTSTSVPNNSANKAPSKPASKVPVKNNPHQVVRSSRVNHRKLGKM